MRFNPPPNWPAPPAGWTPPPGWQPDPAWGPAPEGWSLWLDDAGQPADGPAAAAPTAPLPAPIPAPGPAGPAGHGAPVPPPPPPGAPLAGPAAGAAGAQPAKSGNWIMRHKVISAVAALILLVGFGSALSGGGDDASPTAATGKASSSPKPKASTTTSSSPAASTTTATAEDAADTTTSSTTTTTTPAPPPLPANVSYKGRGNKVLKIRKPEDGAILATFTHKGSANFAVFTLDDGNQESDLLVNTIGRYSGTVLLDDQGTETSKLKITADGSWTLTLKALARARHISTTAKGTGDDVLIYGGPAATLKFASRGEGNVAIFWITEDGGDLLVNDIGHYSGESALTDGPGVLSIKVDGPWTAKITD
jgi:hypothetical protein